MGNFIGSDLVMVLTALDYLVNQYCKYKKERGVIPLKVINGLILFLMHFLLFLLLVILKVLNTFFRDKK